MTFKTLSFFANFSFRSIIESGRVRTGAKMDIDTGNVRSGKPQRIGEAAGRCSHLVCVHEFRERLRAIHTYNFRCPDSFVTSSVEKQPAAAAANDVVERPARRHHMTSRLRPYVRRLRLSPSWSLN